MPISSMRQPPVGQIRASLRLVPQVLKSLRADGEDDLGGFADGPGASGRRSCSSKIQVRFACVCLRLSTGKNPEAGRQTTQPANKNKKSGTPRVGTDGPISPNSGLLPLSLRITLAKPAMFACHRFCYSTSTSRRRGCTGRDERNPTQKQGYGRSKS